MSQGQGGGQRTATDVLGHQWRRAGGAEPSSKEERQRHPHGGVMSGQTVRGKRRKLRRSKQKDQRGTRKEKNPRKPSRKTQQHKEKGNSPAAE